MKQILILVLSMSLAACVTTGVPETPVVVVNTQVIPASTVPLPSPSATAVPSSTPTLTVTPEVTCDPFTADFCVVDGSLVIQRPIQPPGNDRIDPVYGYGSTARRTREPHHGVEFSNPSGTPVHAAAEGTVLFAGPDDRAVYAPWSNFYGNLVVLEHPGQLFTLYAHLSRIDVQIGQKILVGDKLGEVGWTGGAVGSHLHFEVRHGDVEDYFATQNPELWLLPAKDETGNLFGTLRITLLDGAGNLVENANFTIGYYLDPSLSPARTYYAVPYSSDMLNGEENAVVGELSAGHYRIAVEMNGQILERWVEVESGKLTHVVFTVD